LAPQISPREDRIAAFRTVNGNGDIWIVQGKQTMRFTFDRGQDRLPVWSPDGKRIAFDSTRNGPRRIFTKGANGESPEESVLEEPMNFVMNDWSPDGRFLLFLQNNPETQYDIMALALDGDRKPFPVVKTPMSERGGSFSPDGRWVAFHSSESGRPEIWVRQFLPPSSTATGGINEHSEQRQVTTQGGIYPKWSHTGRELYYIAPNGMLMAVPIEFSSTNLQVGTPIPLFDPHVYKGGVDNQQARQYDVSRDGRFLINRVVSESTTPIRLIQNWHPPALAESR
jgi:Tol biopolymer transport system component